MVPLLCYTLFHDLSIVKFIKNRNGTHNMITCAPIQYTVIFRALKIAIV